MHLTSADVDRFWAFVDRRETTECWDWTGARDTAGYGRFHLGARNRAVLAHRVAFFLANGYLPPAARHRCDRPPCCNAAHLLPGTWADNNRDMVERGRHRGGGGRRGVAHHAAKLDDASVFAIRAAYLAGGVSQRALAERHGVSQRTVAKIVTGVGWKHITTEAA